MSDKPTDDEQPAPYIDPWKEALHPGTAEHYRKIAEERLAETATANEHPTIRELADMPEVWKYSVEPMIEAAATLGQSHIVIMVTLNGRLPLDALRGYGKLHGFHVKSAGDEFGRLAHISWGHRGYR